MTGGKRMRNGTFLLLGAAILAGCGGGGVPGFLGREGNAQSQFTFGEDAAQPDQVPMPIGDAVAERALGGAIVRVSGVADAQGYWGAELRPVGFGPDANGVLAFDFIAYPPEEPGYTGVARTRVITAGAFVPTITARKATSVRIVGSTGTRSLTLPAIPDS